MPETYGKWSQTDLDRALTSIKNGDMGFKAAAKAFGVPKTTLARHYNSQNKLAKQQIVHFGTHCALTTEMEEEIVRHVVDLQDAMFPITKADLQRLAFQVAERNGLSTAFSKNKGIAGQKWYAGFLKRHPELSLRRPEATSLARADGFNKEAVNKYFRNVNEIVTKHKLDGTKVYNMDETGLSTVQRPSKVVCLKGKKRAGALTSAEMGVNTTCVICTNAAGNYIPPFLKAGADKRQ